MIRSDETLLIPEGKSTAVAANSNRDAQETRAGDTSPPDRQTKKREVNKCESERLIQSNREGTVTWEKDQSCDS